MTDASSLNAAVIGAGPAGLMAAETLAGAGFAVTVYERMPTPARKLLIAGRGGLNLTHSEGLGDFLTRYRGSLVPRVRAAIEAFPPERLRAWCEALGEETFVGSSGRVFPRRMKASPLLRAWLRRLDAQGVLLKSRHRWVGIEDEGALLFETPGGRVTIEKPAVTVLALGGASWPHLGSDGAWVEILSARGCAVTPLLPANSGFLVSWSEIFRERFAGEPLKRIAITFRGETHRGEAMITKAGLEGGAIYALSGVLRDAILREGSAEIRLDLRPDMTVDALAAALSASRGKASLATFLRKAASLAPQAIGLLQEAAHRDGVTLAKLDGALLAARIKEVSVTLAGVPGLQRAISSAGGVEADAIDDAFMLKRMPGVFVAGEMLDWEAPTGGYLLQASFATGAGAAEAAARWAKG